MFVPKNKQQTRIFTHHEIIHCIPMSVPNESYKFMPTYIPCYIGNKEKASSKKKTS